VAQRFSAAKRHALLHEREGHGFGRASQSQIPSMISVSRAPNPFVFLKGFTTSVHRLGFFGYRQQSDLYPFSSQTSVVPVTDIYPPIGDNGIDLCVGAKVCPSTRTAPKLPSPIWQLLFDNLRRLAGVSGSGTRSRMSNEKRTESRKSLFM